MSATELRVQGYRSIKDLTLPIKPVTIVTGPNGSGKSNLYQAIALIQASAAGRLAHTLAQEGGLPSATFAGHGGTGRIVLGIRTEGFDYSLEVGPSLSNRCTRFALDPFIKVERLDWFNGTKKTCVMEHKDGCCSIRNSKGDFVRYSMDFNPAESALSQVSDPINYPLLEEAKRQILKWRVYHGFRTDSESPMRKPQVGIRTRVIASEGRDLAAALVTIAENGDDLALGRAIDDAFPGARLEVAGPAAGLFQVAMYFPGLNRPLLASELSDGVLRYLCLLAAALSPQPAPLLVLNEPENSLHVSLLAPLARILGEAAPKSQIWLTTHSPILREELEKITSARVFDLDKVEGETVRAGRPKGLAWSEEWDT